MYYERKAEKKEDIQRRRGLKLKKYKIAAAMLGICMVVICGGCSRETLNAQLAESLGTTGMYAGNEPVESPKMKAERELKEKESMFWMQKMNSIRNRATEIVKEELSYIV